MGLAIDVTKVRSVLLADGWHRVVEQSFVIDAYDYVQAGGTRSGGNGSAPPAGYRFKDDAGYILAGPLAAVLASQTAP
ncbi:MAG TPA: hypothetical protein VD793_09320 [Gemmatimonadales bacterium]|nr:hypothetical protein [Gemmatimonadales bacterium]